MNTLLDLFEEFDYIERKIYIYCLCQTARIANSDPAGSWLLWSDLHPVFDGSGFQKLVESGSGLSINILDPFKIELFSQYLLTKVIKHYYYINYIDFYVERIQYRLILLGQN